MNDKSDSTIWFDENGYCNYCSKALIDKEKIYFPNNIGKEKLDDLITTIKESEKEKKYDCIMGLSGGLDSSYLVYLASKWNLRVLAIHVDDGYDTEISKNNLKKLVEKTNVDYIVIKPDEYQYNQLIKAYLKAGVPNICIPQDNILFAAIYKYMRENKIKYFLSGSNYALECILQRGNTHDAYDIDNIFDIHSKFGKSPIDKLNFISNKERISDREFLKIQTICPLNYIDYNKNRAFKELKDFCGFEYYGCKHLENIFTAFAQLYWFPKKFNVDKRTSHLSSMIVSGQMTRDEALRQYEKPLYDDDMMNEYINLIKQRCEITDDEFKSIMMSPPKSHEDFAGIGDIKSRNNKIISIGEIKKYKKIILFGAGKDKKLFDYLSQNLAERLECIIDNDRNKWGDTAYGLKIYSPDALEKYNKDDTVIISCVYHYNKEIEEQMKEFGWDNNFLVAIRDLELPIDYKYALFR